MSNNNRKVYGIRIRRKAGDPWVRGKRFKKVGKTSDGRNKWRVAQVTWASRAAATPRLLVYRAGGWQAHIFEITIPAKELNHFRTQIVGVMDWALANKNRIRYKQIRPIDVNGFRDKNLPTTTDCSGTVVQLCRAVGLPDPTGNNYDGGRTKPTFTGTLRSHTPKRSDVAAALVGDFIVYGTGSGKHVVMVYEQGRDPLCWSFGSDSGPILIRHSAQMRFHGSYHTVHNIGGL